MTPEIRWTVNAASRAWATNVKTVAQGLRLNDIQPGSDGKYSTLQIDKALHGDFEAEKTRDTKASADIREVRLANLRRENIPADMVERVVNNFVAELRQKITYLTELSDARKAELLKDMMAIPTDEYFREAGPEDKTEGGDE